jgi:hypothetical protein
MDGKAVNLYIKGCSLMKNGRGNISWFSVRGTENVERNRCTPLRGDEGGYFYTGFKVK